MPEKRPAATFAGFRGRPDGQFAFTMVPNQFLDEIVPFEKPCVVKVVCLVLRRTIGWLEPNGQRRRQDRLAYSEFVREMNMSTQAVADGLRIALEKGYIIRVKPEGAEPGDGNWYSLRWAISEEPAETTKTDSESQSQNGSNETLQNRDMINKAIPDSKKVELKASSTGSKSRQPRSRSPYSAYIGNVVGEIGEQFGDSDHRLANIRQALNWWVKSGQSEEDFVQLLYQARDLTRAYAKTRPAALPRSEKWHTLAGNSEPLPLTTDFSNRMPYFFRVVRELVEKQSQSNPVEMLPEPPTRLEQTGTIAVLEKPVSPPVIMPEIAPQIGREDWAQRWSVVSAQTLATWRQFIDALADQTLRDVLARLMGVEARLAAPALQAALELTTPIPGGPTEIVLLFENEFEGRYVLQHLSQLEIAACQIWPGPIVFHAVYL